MKSSCCSIGAVALLLVQCVLGQDTMPASKSSFAQLGTNRVHYTVEGGGSNAIAFVHGWSCNAGFWREQVPALAPRARLILIDLPGHGRSDKPEIDYTMEYFASAVVAVLREAKVEKATLVGHSMGVPVICRVQQQGPERVAALVAVDGLLRRPKMQPEQIERFVGPYRTPQYREHAGRFVDGMFPNPGTESLRNRVREEMLATPQQVMRSAMENIFSPTQPSWELNPVKVPLMVINAKNPMWTPEYETYVRTLSNQVGWRTIDGAGHFLMLERPAEFNAALIEMLDKFKLIAPETKR